MSKYYDKDGAEMTLLEWARKFEIPDYRIIEQTKLKNEIFVSTVWLGINHNFGQGKPLIFETMAFSKDGEELEMERYSTLEEAKEGHKKMIKKMGR